MKIISKCNLCGRCCQKWGISLNIKDIKKVNNLGYSLNDFVEVKNSVARLKQKKGRCVFLEPDNSCTIHNTHGYKSKPQVCQSFPHNELVCGIPQISSKKLANPKPKKIDIFFQIDKKSISTPIFIDLIGKIDSRKTLLESYCNLLLNILNQEQDIILDKIKIKNYNINLPKKLKRKIEDPILVFRSKSLFPYLNKFLNKSIKLKLPTQDFKFKFENIEIPQKTKKQFIQYLKASVEKNQIFSNYPSKLIVMLYFLPYFSKSLAENQKINLIHTVHAFSLLNGMHRFGELVYNGEFGVENLEKNLCLLNS
ncbi:MAG: YkgJ family cysteine cluster protein [archaeon]